MLRKTGRVDLWLVSGGVPHFREMVRLAGPISAALVELGGTEEIIRRLSHPVWFQSLACVLGWEWNTSGATTVTASALKIALEKENLGVKILGGKGKKGRGISEELEKVGEELSLSGSKIESAKYASRMSAKADSAALQDLNGPIYFHAEAIDEKGRWSIIQQKMDVEEGKARRYHWLHGIKDFVDEPHSGIQGNKQPVVLDLTAHQAEDARKTIVDIARDTPARKIGEEIERIRKGQTRLTDFFDKKVKKIPYLLPERPNLKALSNARELGVRNFEELLGIRGIGGATIRGLAYLSSLIYGAEPSWSDPAKYQWAYGTKSGFPYYVRKTEMRKSAEILEQAIGDAKLGKREKLEAIRRLKDFLE